MSWSDVERYSSRAIHQQFSCQELVKSSSRSTEAISTICSAVVMSRATPVNCLVSCFDVYNCSHQSSAAVMSRANVVKWPVSCCDVKSYPIRGSVLCWLAVKHRRKKYIYILSVFRIPPTSFSEFYLHCLSFILEGAVDIALPVLNQETESLIRLAVHL